MYTNKHDANKDMGYFPVSFYLKYDKQVLLFNILLHRFTALYKDFSILRFKQSRKQEFLYMN